jgi:hypothetical protein
MTDLVTAPNLPDPDAIFAALMDAHRDLDPDSSRRLDAALVLLLANHIGDPAVILAALTAARIATHPNG